MVRNLRTIDSSFLIVFKVMTGFRVFQSLPEPSKVALSFCCHYSFIPPRGGGGVPCIIVLSMLWYLAVLTVILHELIMWHYTMNSWNWISHVKLDLTLHKNKGICYEVKIEESEKGRQPPGVEPRHLCLEPPVLCHWATATGQPPNLTILYMYTVHRGILGSTLGSCWPFSRSSIFVT